MTISLCMIVKNEERVLGRCLSSVADLVDEIVIVDTGSSDGTKRIAEQYGAVLYDFAWIQDFSAARNFAFSKCSCDYIYSADADEVIDEENRHRFRLLKENLLPEIDIVQMKYGNQLSHGTVYNFDEEYRPKLFKRLRPFVWEEPVHEQVRLTPVVYDSDIVITHLPENNHSGRDIEILEKQLQLGRNLSNRLLGMYLRELYLNGNTRQLHAAMDYLQSEAEAPGREDLFREICVLLAKNARLSDDSIRFFKYCNKVIVGEGCSEACYEMGLFYENHGDEKEALLWFYNAAFETEPVLCKKIWDADALMHLEEIYHRLHQDEEAKHCAAVREQRCAE